MTNSRKQVRAELVVLEKKFKHHQQNLSNYNYDLHKLTGGSHMALVVTLVPAFMIGWRIARSDSSKQAIKRLINAGLLGARTLL